MGAPDAHEADCGLGGWPREWPTLLVSQGEVICQDEQIIFVGHDFPGEVDVTHACGNALIAPGFIDLDALADLDTTILGLDNQPG